MTISFANISDWTLERQLPGGSWVGVPDGELSWSHDTLRWTPIYSPSDPPTEVGIDWLADDRTEAGFNWVPFASGAGGGEPTIGNPGPGEWNITPKIDFSAPFQSNFFAQMGTEADPTPDDPTADDKDVAEIASIQWIENTTSGRGGELVGEKFFPDATSPLFEANNYVDVLVQLTPELSGVNIVADIYDVDDSTDHDGPIDEDPDPATTDVNNQDNLPTGGGASLSDIPPSDENGQIRFAVLVDLIQPGNNFRVAAGARQEELDPVKPLSETSQSELFYDADNDGFWDVLEEALLEEGSFEHGIRVTPRLTVWRKLHVEVDSMGLPPQGTVFPDDGIPIDVNPGDVPAPDTGLLASAFADAFVEVVLGTQYDEGDVPFVYHVTNPSAANRGLDESAAYWAAYVIGAYEGSSSLDGDPDTQSFLWGENFSAEPEHAFIYHEVLRDGHNDGAFPNWQGVYSQTKHEQQTTVHEIGHQFELAHAQSGISIMSSSGPNRPDTFAEDELKKIRETQSP